MKAELPMALLALVGGSIAIIKFFYEFTVYAFGNYDTIPEFWYLLGGVGLFFLGLMTYPFDDYKLKKGKCHCGNITVLSDDSGRHECIECYKALQSNSNGGIKKWLKIKNNLLWQYCLW